MARGNSEQATSTRQPDVPPVLPDPVLLGQQAARNRERLVALFATVDDITWGQHLRRDRQWSMQDLISHLLAGEERAARLLQAALADRPVDDVDRADRPLHIVEQDEIDERHNRPAVVMLAEYAAASAHRLESIAALTPTVAGRAWHHHPILPGPVVVGQVPAALWLDHLRHEADLRRTLKQPPLATVIATEEAHALLSTAIGLLPAQQAFGQRASAGTPSRGVLFRLTGPGRGVWSIGPEGAVAPDATDLRIDGSISTFVGVIAGERSAWQAIARGDLRFSGHRPWRALRVLAALRG